MRRKELQPVCPGSEPQPGRPQLSGLGPARSPLTLSFSFSKMGVILCLPQRPCLDYISHSK